MFASLSTIFSGAVPFIARDRTSHEKYLYGTPSLYEVYVVDGIIQQQFCGASILWMFPLVRVLLWGFTTESADQRDGIRRPFSGTPENTTLEEAVRAEEGSKIKRTLMGSLREKNRVLFRLWVIASGIIITVFWLVHLGLRFNLFHKAKLEEFSTACPAYAAIAPHQSSVFGIPDALQIPLLISIPVLNFLVGRIYKRHRHTRRLICFNAFVVFQHYKLCSSLYRILLARHILSDLAATDYQENSLGFGQILSIFVWLSSLYHICRWLLTSTFMRSEGCKYSRYQSSSLRLKWDKMSNLRIAKKG